MAIEVRGCLCLKGMEVSKLMLTRTMERQRKPLCTNQRFEHFHDKIVPCEKSIKLLWRLCLLERIMAPFPTLPREEADPQGKLFKMKSKTACKNDGSRYKEPSSGAKGHRVIATSTITGNYEVIICTVLDMAIIIQLTANEIL